MIIEQNGSNQLIQGSPSWSLCSSFCHYRGWILVCIDIMGHMLFSHVDNTRLWLKSSVWIEKHKGGVGSGDEQPVIEQEWGENDLSNKMTCLKSNITINLAIGVVRCCGVCTVLFVIRANDGFPVLSKTIIVQIIQMLPWEYGARVLT